jgi:hypothetical protein
MTIRLELDSDSTDSDGGHDGEPNSDVAETTIPSGGEYAGKTDGYDGEPGSDVAETAIPSDGEYAGETDSDGAEINIGVAVGTIGSASGTGQNSGTSMVGTNSIGLISVASIEATSVLGCLVLAVSSMTTFCLEGNLYNGEPPPHKNASLKRDKDT